MKGEMWFVKHFPLLCHLLVKKCHPQVALRGYANFLPAHFLQHHLGRWCGGSWDFAWWYCHRWAHGGVKLPMDLKKATLPGSALVTNHRVKEKGASEYLAEKWICFNWCNFWWFCLNTPDFFLPLVEFLVWLMSGCFCLPPLKHAYKSCWPYSKGTAT